MSASLSSPTLTRLRWHRWLPADPKRRLRAGQTALACLFSLASVAFMAYGVAVDLVSAQALWIWVLLVSAGSAGFVTAIASGWSERFADPSLTVAQMAYAIGCCAWAYAVAGPLRGGLFLLLMVVMMFGMFALPLRRMLGVCAVSVLTMGLAMVWQVNQPQGGTPAAVEAGHLLMLLVTLPAVALLAARLRQMRKRLLRQKAELAEALARIQYLATRDALTGLVNRGHLGELLAREVQRQRRKGARLSVLLIDVDHFKQVNDRHGHACGDAVLRSLAERSLDCVRASDTLGRWGGEEFLLLMPDTGLEDARTGAERLRLHLAREAVQHQGLTVPVTMSGGLAELRDGESPEALLERADQALYRAKALGRNRVEAAAG
ncbi:MAG: diguanylate cyclase [Burkholderiaceae bacterium]|nr:diguanylate cyclase [Burkholderiaceae bacterium]